MSDSRHLEGQTALVTGASSGIGRAIAEELGRHVVDGIVATGGPPAEIAHLVAFLASPMASYITGALYAVDGGSGA